MTSRILIILSIPFLFLLFLYVRELRHERWMMNDKITKDSTIAAEFTKNKLVKEELYSTIPVDSTDIVFLGTSITEPMPLTEFANTLHIRNHAINGATIKEISRQAQLVAQYHPRKIFIEVGI